MVLSKITRKAYSFHTRIFMGKICQNFPSTITTTIFHKKKFDIRKISYVLNSKKAAFIKRSDRLFAFIPRDSNRKFHNFLASLYF